MNMTLVKQGRRQRRKQRIRKRVMGTAERPRLSVYRSLTHVYAQLIDDVAGRTLVSASTVDLHLAPGGNVKAAQAVGKALAEKAQAAGLKKAVFDRNGFRYHGRIKALADAARAGGLEF